MQPRTYATALGAIGLAALATTAVVVNLPGDPVELPVVAIACSSQDPEGPCTHALPGRAGFWVSRWQPSPPQGFPHTVTLDLGEPRELHSLSYLPRSNPRTDGTRPSGDIREYELRIDERVVIARGTLVAPGTADFAARLVDLRGQTGQRIKLTLFSNADGTAFASAEEFKVWGFMEEPAECCEGQWARCDTFKPIAGADPCCLTPMLQWAFPAMVHPTDLTKEQLGMKLYADGAIVKTLPCNWPVYIDRETGEQYERRDCPGIDYPVALQRFTDIEGRVVRWAVSSYNRFGESPQTAAYPACMPRTYRRGE